MNFDNEDSTLLENIKKSIIDKDVSTLNSSGFINASARIRNIRNGLIEFKKPRDPDNIISVIQSNLDLISKWLDFYESRRGDDLSRIGSELEAIYSFIGRFYEEFGLDKCMGKYSLIEDRYVKIKGT